MKKLLLKKSLHKEYDAADSKLIRKDTVYSVKYHEELNPAQYAAVFHNEGPALVLAGAGTGKTRILVYRLTRLVEDGIPPQHILLLTFTRKSANEMLSRASMMLNGKCEQVSGGTFHSFAHQIIRKFAQEIGFESNFSVLDQSDMEDAINIIRTQITKEYGKKRFPQKHTLASMYSLSVNKCLPIQEILRSSYPQFIDETDKIQELFRAYIAYKRKQNMLDYDDLLVYLLTLLETNKSVRNQLQAQYRYIMIDEYQDTNSLQHRIVLALSGTQKNIMAVGDDAQSIYSFRGANFKNILDFPSSFEHCDVYPIEQNYRSVQSILDFSNSILEHATFGYKKNLFSTLDNQEHPYIIATSDERQQSEFIVQQILEYRESGISLNQMAALIRSGYMSFDLEIALTKANIPFKKFGGFKFIETAHIKDILSFFRIANNPKDVLAWHRILLLLEGIGPGTANMIIEEISENRLDFRYDNGWNTISRGKEELSRLCNLLRKIQSDDIKMSERMYLCNEFYRPILKKKYDDYPKRWKDIETFTTIAEQYNSTAILLSEMALDPPIQTAEANAEYHEDEFFTISTIHSAKGLEWNTVFLLWALEGKFPPNKSLQSIDQLEEERRLMYVAITRAKEHVFVLYPVNIFDRETGMVLGSPSRFLDGIEHNIAERYVLQSGEEQQ